jgi:hypothetical protein
MKLKKFNQLLLEREGFDDIDEPFDSETEDEGTPSLEEDEEDTDDVEDEETSEDDMIEHLLSTLRKMIRNSSFGEKSYIFRDSEDGAITLQFILNKTEKMGNIMKVLNFIKKVESDILIQYNSEFELWETKQGDPLFTIKFFYDEEVEPELYDDTELPF